MHELQTKQPHRRVLSSERVRWHEAEPNKSFICIIANNPQLSTGAPRIEEGQILRRNQHQRPQQTVERESTDKLTSYGQIKDQKHNKSTRIQEANISTTLITLNSSEISRAMEKISETNHLMAQQQIAQQRVLQALLL